MSVLLPIPERQEWSSGKELYSDTKNGMDELTLTDRIALTHPADLPFSNCMHRLVTLDVRHALSAERKPRLAVIRFLMNR